MASSFIITAALKASSRPYLAITLTGFALLLAFAIYVIHALFFSRYSQIPGPKLCKISRVWLTYHDFNLQRNEKIFDWHQKYGPVVLIAPGEVSLSSHSATREIYGAAGRHPKSNYFDRFATYGERPTFTAKGYDEHLQKRKLTFALFQPRTIFSEAYVGPIRSRVKAFVDQVGKDLDSTTTLEFFTRLTFYVFDNMSRFCYGPRHCAKTIENQCPERQILRGLRECEIWSSRLLGIPLLLSLLRKVISVATGNRNFLRSEHQLTEWNTQVIARARVDQQTPDDNSLLQLLVGVQPKNKIPLTLNYISSEILDVVNGAQTTTTVSLTYILWNLACNPEWQKRIYQELSVLPLQGDGMPSFADINASPVLDACIKESYRVNPSSSGRAERIVPIGKEYDGVFIPGGTIVSTSTVSMHRSLAAFPDPRTYDPGRWLTADKEHAQAMELCYMPFGYGSRVCIGRALATVQIKLLIAGLLMKYRIHNDDQSPTNVSSMVQLSTQDALPRGLRCDLKVSLRGCIGLGNCQIAEGASPKQ